MQDYSGYGGYGGYGQPPSGDYGHTAPLPPMPPPPPPRRRVGLLSYLAVALVAGALGAGSVVALYHPASNSTAAPSPWMQRTLRTPLKFVASLAARAGSYSIAVTRPRRPTKCARIAV